VGHIGLPEPDDRRAGAVEHNTENCRGARLTASRIPHGTTMTAESGFLRQCAARTVVATTAFLSVACASAPRNPVLDKYPPGVMGRTTVFYYDVHGSTFAELRADMRRLGPKIDGSNFVGETRSPMLWSWRTQSTSAGGCSIRTITVSVNAQITLPRWSPPSDTEPGLVTEWKRFLAVLETHEAGHKDISAKAGREIVERLRDMSGVCSQISVRADEIARVIVERANGEQKAYDASTRHGLTQGTSFGAGRVRGTIVLDARDSLTLLVGPRPGTVRGILAASVDGACTALPASYAAAGLTINAVDSAAHVVGDSITVRGRVGMVPVSELVDCGMPPAGSTFDSVAVALFVMSRVEASQPSGSAMTNTVQAITRPSGASAIACRSRGVLESRLFDALRGSVTR
jgi:predicted secreted Zn-dependent protease